MANYIFEIGDEEGKSFKINVSAITTFAAGFDGSWRTIDSAPYLVSLRVETLPRAKAATKFPFQLTTPESSPG